MTRCVLIGLLGVALGTVGCASTKSPEAALPASEVAAVPPTRTEAPVRSAAEQVQSAVRYAFGLEATLFAQAEAMTSQEDVAMHFRQGFAPALADDFAAYFWDRDRLRTGDPTLVPPDEVVVLSSDAEAAIAYFETPVALRQTWGLPRYTRVEMAQRSGRWIVAATRQQDARPR
ncbi:MAG: hypothetical protein AAFP18_10570 [Bacteroidota bacterium]